MTAAVGDGRKGSASAFSIAGVDAYHLVAREKSYWNEFRPGSRSDTGRFVLKPGWRTVYGRNVETAILKVTLSDGSVGYGEATEPICPELICQLAVRLLAPVLGGTSFAHPKELWAQGYELQRGRGHVAGYHMHTLAALDIAVWDALGRREGVPVAALLADQARKSVPVYLSGIRRGTVTQRIDHLADLVSGGLTAVKIFASSDTAETIQEADALRAAVPGSWDLMVDTLWSYDDVGAAADLGRQLADRHVRWLECPLVPEDLGAHKRLLEETSVPVALGEHFFCHHQSEPWLRASARHVFQPDVGRTGISDGLRQARMAPAGGIDVTAHMGSGSPIVQAAGLQFWSALSTDTPCEYQFDLAALLPDVFQTAWVYRNGALTMPDRPGLGVEVNEEGLAANSASVEGWRSA